MMLSVLSFSDQLLSRQLITQTDLHQARQVKRETGGLLGQALLRIGAISEEDLLDVLSEYLDLPILDGARVPTDRDQYDAALLRLNLTAAGLVARKCAVWCPPGVDIASNATETAKPIIFIAQDVLQPELREHLDHYSARTGHGVKVFLVSNQSLERALNILRSDTRNPSADEDDMDSMRLKEIAEEAPVIDFVNGLFATALKENASDIHVEPFQHTFIVRFRIDGVLHPKHTESKSMFDAVSSRLKLLSGMDIAERRLPQDGRQTIRFAGQEIDLRVSSVPGSWGESLVLRLLTKDDSLNNLGALGLDGQARQVLQNLLAQPNGIVLVTGPTGSGKSTTLYQSLVSLNDGITKIITIEDPVEYDINGVVQIQTNASIGYTFAKGLRAILRQDPDIIMVGEIRDGETAQISAQAALTGHLVLSTLHTNSSLDAIARLIDMGLEPFMVGAAIRGLIAQRLVRRVCPHCSVPGVDEEGEALIAELMAKGIKLDAEMATPPAWRVAKGCEHCLHTGYQGRIAIYEAVMMDETLSNRILTGATVQELTKAARKQGFVTLFEDGLCKARRGLTTLAEVRRVCGNAKVFSES